MTKQRGLIVGTSHTYGECFGERNSRLEPQDRWYGGIAKKHDVKVIGLNGITNDGICCLLETYKKFDLTEPLDFIIIEGRVPMSRSVTMPIQDFDDDHHEFTRESWHEFVEDPTQSDPHDSLVRTFNTLGSDKDYLHQSYGNYAQLYAGTRLQIMHTFTSAYTACSIAQSMAKKVLFMPAIGLKGTGEQKKRITRQFDLLINQYTPRTEPSIWDLGFTRWAMCDIDPELDKDTSIYMCQCGHVNARGNRVIQDKLAPLLYKELGI